ncbi:multidrug effflux MFS transporter [Francisella philomiragia]|uniref:Bcr/CflA family efflux transporter n=2 Tax=Francisella philomiragia TaxID=28110 RepID=A0A0B6CK07_9GAMM|nr:multidrug effflux MFS transporter [Francisella philomiragia]AJI46758.1 drug resistance transporter, Bcr/CflA subfamily protein [Francisella philomiragia]AJI49195.1 drug resistance transporter, Bcr/CflA subfamily protein [Francisella philomiragia]AJI53237.1 drug resistance transporter, Bcr/CflA subfamily protein [Francisella philomiragia]AJI55427.1 drug resistance transporter, Bcr/CflA subfamily protein [Francisella philomiragia]AJI57496.1 drug resistance transporter, Bcr/CflA subfamily prot
MYKGIRPSIFILILMVSLGPFGDTIYAPALPEIKTILGTDYPHVQLTITSYLLGYSVSQLLYGPFSDRFGRKPVMLVGSGFFIISSIICLLSTNIDTLIYARLLQGFGAAAGGVIATVAVKDAFKVSEQGAIFAIMNIAFALAPAFGAILGVFLSPNLIFWILLVAATFLFIQVTVFFPETVKEKNIDALTLRSFFKNYFSLFKDHQFFFATFVLGINISVIYACLVTAPDIFINILKLEKANFLYLLTIMVTAVVLGSIICSKLSRVIAYKHLVNFGMLCTLISGLLFIYAFHKLTGLTLSIALTGVLSLTFIGVSFSVPLLTPIALENFTTTAGAASSVMGFMQMGIASITTAVISQIHFGSEFTLAFAFVLLPLIGLIIFFPYSCYFLKK